MFILVTNTNPTRKGTNMKAVEIEKMANAEVAKLMSEGYAIEMLGEIYRNDAIILKRTNGKTLELRMVKVERGGKYGRENICVKVYEYAVDPRFSGVLWESEADSVREGETYYEISRRSGWFGTEEEMQEAKAIHRSRYGRDNADADVELDASKASDEFYAAIRKQRGFARATRKNTRIVKHHKYYVITCGTSSHKLYISSNGIRNSSY